MFFIFVLKKQYLDIINSVNLRFLGVSLMKQNAYDR